MVGPEYTALSCSTVLLIYTLNFRDKKINFFVLLTVVGGRVSYQAWQELGCVWLELVRHECLGQSGIWTGLDGELCHLLGQTCVSKS